MQKLSERNAEINWGNTLGIPHREMLQEPMPIKCIRIKIKYSQVPGKKSHSINQGNERLGEGTRGVKSNFILKRANIREFIFEQENLQNVLTPSQPGGASKIFFSAVLSLSKNSIRFVVCSSFLDEQSL